MLGAISLLAGCFPGVLLPLGPAELPNGVRLAKGFCGPLVPARINDTLGWFELDSGAYMHIVTPELVERAQLPIDITVENAGPHGRHRVGVTDLVIPRVVRIDRPELSVADDDSNLATNMCGMDGLLGACAARARRRGAGRRLSRAHDDDDARSIRSTSALAGRDGRFNAVREEAEYAPADRCHVWRSCAACALFVDTGSFATFVTKDEPGRPRADRAQPAGRRGSIASTAASVRVSRTRRSGSATCSAIDPHVLDRRVSLYDDGLGGVLGWTRSRTACSRSRATKSSVRVLSRRRPC